MDRGQVTQFWGHAYTREEMKSIWPLSPAKGDLDERDSVSFRPEAKCAWKKKVPTASWKISA